MHEEIRYFKCQACGKKFIPRRNTVLTGSGPFCTGGKDSLASALGVDVSALEAVFGVREVAIRTWLCRSGMQGKKLHERYMAEKK